MARGIERVGVVGLGTMGAGIAQLCVEAGLDTVGHEAEAARGTAARDRIAHFLGRKVEKADELKPAIEEAAKAVKAGRSAILNIICDPVPNAR